MDRLKIIIIKKHLSASPFLSCRVIQADTPKVGSIVSGVVERLTPAAVVVSVNGFCKGSILNEHLADHRGMSLFFFCILHFTYIYLHEETLFPLDTHHMDKI